MYVNNFNSRTRAGFSKPSIIILITVILLIALSTLLFFSDRIVGKAIQFDQTSFDQVAVENTKITEQSRIPITERSGTVQIANIPQTVPESELILKGDIVGNDNCVDGKDIQAIIPHIDLTCKKGSKKATEGDVNKDGCVNGADIQAIIPEIDLKCIPKVKPEEKFNICRVDTECPFGNLCRDGNCVPIPPAKGTSLGEVFVGPLAGWKNLKTDFNAVGDGIADDTKALQTALNSLYTTASVLYIPAGTYKITSSLNFLEKSSNPFDIKIIGEDPKKTKIVWDGAKGGTMFKYNPNYASMSRLTLDGNKKAGEIINYSPNFKGWAEFADMVFQDAAKCLELGVKGTGIGITDSVILRSSFLRCSDVAVHLRSCNSYQWEIWDSYFEDNNIGVSNVDGCGNYHIYQSSFKNSKITDTASRGGLFSSIRDSTSIGSNAFHISTGSSATQIITLQRNKIKTKDVMNSPPYPPFSPACSSPICIGNRGTLVMLDNVISTKNKPVQDFQFPGTFIFMGNTFTVNNWLNSNVKGTKLTDIDNKVVSKTAVNQFLPKFPKNLLKINTDVFEVSPGNDDTVTIQKAINDAAKSNKKKPVVHLQRGKYLIKDTLVVPANTDLQIIGDGMLSRSSLIWKGKGKGPLIRVDGPSQATFKDFNIDGLTKTRHGIIVTGVEQPGSRIRTNQILVAENKISYFINKLQEPIVEFLSTAAGHGNIGFKVIGNGRNKKNSKILHMGEGGSVADVTYDITDAEFLVRDVWTESRVWLTPHFINLKGETTFTAHNFFQSHPRDSNPSKRTIVVDNVDGKASFIGALLSPNAMPKSIPSGTSVSPTYINRKNPLINSVPTIDVRGTKPTKFLIAGSRGRGKIFTDSSNTAKTGQLDTVTQILKPGVCTELNIDKCYDTILLNDLGDTSKDFLKEMFAQTRNYGEISYASTPTGATDLFFNRMRVANVDTGLTLTPSYCGNNIQELGESCDDGKLGKCSYGQNSCKICSSQCTGFVLGKTSYCGDKICDIKHETDSCNSDCISACPSKDLLHWWPGESTAEDLVSGNDGSLHGGMTYSSGKVRGSFNFDGVNDFIQTENTEKFTALTFSAWVKPALDGTEIILGSKGNALGYTWFVSGSGNGGLFLNGGSPIVNGKNAFNGIPYKLKANEWAHVAVSWDKNTGFKAYKNGVQISSVGTNLNEITWGGNLLSGFAIGTQRTVGPINLYKGNIDELSIWNRALSQQEISGIFQAGSKGMCAQP